jgi:predicted dehydrogenase
MLKLSAETDSKFDLRSVCDLWSVNRERAAEDAKQIFGSRPKTFQYSEEILADKDLDAVMIGPATISTPGSWRRS